MPCEICGGYIQGVQALRVHMQWCHNINITHLKAPGFRCANENCFKPFWTVQGLAKHTAVSTINYQNSVSIVKLMAAFAALIMRRNNSFYFPVPLGILQNRLVIKLNKGKRIVGAEHAHRLKKLMREGPML